MPVKTRMDYHQMARRFAKGYLAHPPGVDHDLYVVANGGKLMVNSDVFAPISPQFLHHDNSGKDIGAYRMAATQVPCDFMVCVGAPVRPRRDEWLETILAAMENHGPGIYGTWGAQVPYVHLRTTFFCIQPELLNAYPYEVDDAHRYQFEHSKKSITQWCIHEGFSAMQVTRRGVFAPERFHPIREEDSLMLDQHCDAMGWKDIDEIKQGE